MDALLQQYDLTTDEGVALMRLAEALIRTPDFDTSRHLIRDKLGAAHWAAHRGDSPSALVNRATDGLALSTRWIKQTGGPEGAQLLAKMGDRVLNAAVESAMGLMGLHFVLGQSIAQAIAKAKRHATPRAAYSYDMLGEAAHTAADAERYFNAYLEAIQSLASDGQTHNAISEAPGVSVKLSALHPRFEYAHRETCVPALAARVRELALIAKSGNLGLTIDAEEAERLETGLLVFDELLRDPALADWKGLGIVVQAYQRRAPALIGELIRLARANDREIAVRLVKGAYWDTEIKRAQELGLESYPVFTRKENTDVSYLACAQMLLDAPDCIYPQFATHNAHTLEAIFELAGDAARFEIQRLHGMGEALHEDARTRRNVTSRVYAPVGAHADLLPYLVRRLLENGANSSFVHQLMDPSVAVESIVRDPIAQVRAHPEVPNPNIPAPRDLFSGERQSAVGLDATQSIIAAQLETTSAATAQLTARPLINGQARGEGAQPIFSPAHGDRAVGAVCAAAAPDVDTAVAAAKSSDWSARSPEHRAEGISRAADLLEADLVRFSAICVAEAGKTLPDAIADVREAIDFCRYYAAQALRPRMADRQALGPVACISPWNFPVAIFLGQITAALAAGNTVIAKPAEQTPVVAYEAVKLLHRVGVAADALQLLPGGGEIGAQLVRHPHINGICFTGSTATAKRIARNLAETGRADIPFIAETGGLNAMIVDSTALLEQAVSDAAASAFQSAGQRCSACRLVCVQDDIADEFITMLSGTLQALHLGDPTYLASDVGPVIDAAAHAKIADYVRAMRARFDVIGETPKPDRLPDGHFIAPVAFEVSKISDLKEEIFGPVLHLVRYRAQDLHSVIEQINALGFGLTMGVHTRIDTRARALAERAHVGNLYVNRNQIGAVVGVQPFGGEGLSGTGPKAGGPNYVLRLSRPAEHPYPAEPTGHATPVATREIAPPSSALLACIETARCAQAQWFKKDRTAILSAYLRTRPQGAADNTRLEAIAATERSTALPGPTGEQNTLTLYPRGVLLCFGGAQAEDLLAQALTALAAGSAVLAAASEEVAKTLSPLRRHLQAEADLADALVIIDPADAATLLDASINGVMVDGPTRSAIAERVARRSGEILPILSLWDDPERLFIERTLTINTAAAGGNVSLLSLEG